MRKGQKYEILKNWAENWSLEPKLDRKWAKKGATMANNVKENKFRSKLGQGKKIFLSRNRGKNDTKIKKKKK